MPGFFLLSLSRGWLYRLPTRLGCDRCLLIVYNPSTGCIAPIAGTIRLHSAPHTSATQRDGVLQPTSSWLSDTDRAI